MARPLDPAERLDWLRLARTERVGPVTFAGLIARFGGANAALEAVPELARRGGRRKVPRIPTRDDAQRELDILADLDAVMLCAGEPEYPAVLAAITDAPPAIAVRGNPSLLSRRSVGVVGARNASANGRALARELAADLSAAGFVVVSGMARGIDTAAHEGALDGGTVAVLAGGVDVPYPAQNADLYAAICERGAVVAEMAPGTAPQARHFPRRNRIIAGLSAGVVVAEAAMRSGSLITARMALEQGREVFAVPGSPRDSRSKGTNHLLRQGAVLTESADDVLAALGGVSTEGLAAPATPPYITESAPQAPVETDDAVRATVTEALGPAPVTVDELVRECAISAPEISAVLLELELAGRLDRLPGGRIALIK